MLLAITATAERGKPVVRTGNECIKALLTHNRREIGQLDMSIEIDGTIYVDFTDKSGNTTRLIEEK